MNQRKRNKPNFGIKTIAVFCSLTVLLSTLTLPAQAQIAPNQALPLTPTQPKLIYLLQDAHESLAVQEQLAEKIIQLNLENQIDLIGFEGAEGEIDGSPLKYLASKEQIDKAATHFVKQGYLGAAELAFFNSDSPLQLLGAETSDIYTSNLSSYRTLLEQRTNTVRILNKIEKHFSDIRPNFVHAKEHKKLEALSQKLFTPPFDLLRWFKQIDPILRWQRMIIKENTAYFKLRQLVASLEQPIKNKSNILALIEQMRTENLLTEFQDLTWQLRFRMTNTKAQKQWLRSKQYLALIRKMCLGELTPNEWETLKHWESPAQIQQTSATLFMELSPVLNEAEQFYTLAELRSYLMAQNLVNAMAEKNKTKAILVTGGFHTPHIQKLFMEKNIQTKVWAPTLNEINRDIPYAERILQKNFIPLKNNSSLTTNTIRLESGLSDEYLLDFGRLFQRELGLLESVSDLVPVLTEPSNANSLGTSKTQTQQQDFGKLFEDLLSGFSPASSSFDDLIIKHAEKPWLKAFLLRAKKWMLNIGLGTLIFKKPLFENKGPYETWALSKEASPKSAEEVIKSLLGSPELANAVWIEYRDLTNALNFSETSATPAIEGDLLFYALDRVAKKIGEIDVQAFREKKKMVLDSLSDREKGIKVPGESTQMLSGLNEQQEYLFYGKRKTWDTFWTHPWLAQLFVQQMGNSSFEQKKEHGKIPFPSGSTPSELIREKAAEFAGRAQISSSFVFNDSGSGNDLRNLTSAENVKSPVGYSGSIQYTLIWNTPKIPPTKTQIETALIRMENFVRMLEPIQKGTAAARKLYLKNHNTAETQLQMRIRNLRNRSKTPSITLEIKKILQKYVNNPKASYEELVEGLRARFILSPAFGLFKLDQFNVVSNWDEVLLAYVNDLAESRDSSNKLRSFLQTEIEKDPKILKLMWALYFPYPGENHPDKKIGKWEKSYSVYPVESEFTTDKRGRKIIEDEEFVAFWLHRTRIPVIENYQLTSFVLLGPETSVKVNPFLTLNNPSKTFLLFEIKGVRTGNETASLVTDDLKRRIIGQWIISNELALNQKKPSLYDRDTKLLEVTQADPVNTIIAFHDQNVRATQTTLRDNLNITAREDGDQPRVLHRGEKTTLIHVPGINEESYKVFDPTLAREVRDRDYTQVTKKLELIAGQAMIVPLQKKVAENNGLIRDTRSAQEDLARLAITGTNRSWENEYEHHFSAKKRHLRFAPTRELVHLKVEAKAPGEKEILFGIEFRERTLSFIFYEDGSQDGHTDGNKFTRKKLLGFQGRGRYIMALALQYFESQPSLGSREKILYDSWRPYLIEVYRKVRGEMGLETSGNSLGVMLRDRPQPLSLNPLQTLSSDAFTIGERLRLHQHIIPQITEQQEGPYELLVYWSALKKGILFPNLAKLVSSIENLNIVIVDDTLTGEEIFRELQQRDPKHTLRSHLVKRKIIIPKSPKLQIQLKRATEKLKNTYNGFTHTFLGVVFPDTHSESEIISQAPSAMKFVAQGDLALGTISRAAFSLVRGSANDLFDTHYQGNSKIWTLSLAAQEVADNLRLRFQNQIALQLSA